MESKLPFDILPQPDDTTCGPTCLHAIYSYFEDQVPLEKVIAETPQLEDGGTLAVSLACHALRRGYQATIYTYNLQVFDPSWFYPDALPLTERLQAQMRAKDNPRLHLASRAYLEYLASGGTIRMEDLTGSLIRKYLQRSRPILTGLSATYLYRDCREDPVTNVDDDIGGYPAGHFVVLCGYDPTTRSVLVADPLMPNPLATSHVYVLDIDRVICAILLGILTHDANLLIVEPKPKPKRKTRVHPHRG